jgi:hypothetical protein
LFFLGSIFKNIFYLRLLLNLPALSKPRIAIVIALEEKEIVNKNRHFFVLIYSFYLLLYGVPLQGVAPIITYSLILLEKCRCKYILD